MSGDYTQGCVIRQRADLCSVSLIALIYGCVGGGGGSDEIGQHCFEREQKLSGVNDNEEGSVRLNRLNCDPIEGRVLESEKLIRKPPNELGIH